jgi:peptidoglycan/xylan/chitin deacetylase (PgdA/CDA1 family)
MLCAVSGLGAAPVRAIAAPEAQPAASPGRLAPAVLLTHGARNRRVVALTFDDGYNPAACRALVDILERTATPATFFPNSMNVERTPALWQRVAALGFPIGNHTATHPLMPRLTYSNQLAQIAADRRAVEDVIGGPSLLVFRPPYGAFSRGTLVAAREAGYPIVLNWDASFADSSRRPNGRPWPISSYVRAASRGKAGSVVLGHCGSQIDVAALPAVIASYRARGFTFVTVPQLLGLSGATPMYFPAGPTLPGSVVPVPASFAPATGTPATPAPESPAPVSWPVTSPAPWSSPAASRVPWSWPMASPAPGGSMPSSSPTGSPARAAESQRWQSRVRTMPIP